MNTGLLNIYFSFEFCNIATVYTVIINPGFLLKHVTNITVNPKVLQIVKQVDFNNLFEWEDILITVSKQYLNSCNPKIDKWSILRHKHNLILLQSEKLLQIKSVDYQAICANIEGIPVEIRNSATYNKTNTILSHG